MVWRFRKNSSEPEWQHRLHYRTELACVVQKGSVSMSGYGTAYIGIVFCCPETAASGGTQHPAIWEGKKIEAEPRSSKCAPNGLFSSFFFAEYMSIKITLLYHLISK